MAEIGFDISPWLNVGGIRDLIWVWHLLSCEHRDCCDAEMHQLRSVDEELRGVRRCFLDGQLHRRSPTEGIGSDIARCVHLGREAPVHILPRGVALDAQDYGHEPFRLASPHQPPDAGPREGPSRHACPDNGALDPEQIAVGESLDNLVVIRAEDEAAVADQAECNLEAVQLARTDLLVPGRCETLG